MTLRRDLYGPGHEAFRETKTFISNGILADLVVVVARTMPEGGSGGLSLLVVERGMEGFERGRNLDKTGQKAEDTAELFFADVRVPKENLLGELGVVGPVSDQGADFARTAATLAGLPDTVAGVQENRFCASGLEAVNMAAMKVRSGWEDLVLAGGVESMSRVPMGSDGGAWALDPRTNHDTGFVPQGIGADLIAIGSKETGECHGLTPRARIVSAAVCGADPTIMLTGPAPASRKALAKAGLTVDDIGLVEINEAFAAVVLRYVKDMGLSLDRVNVNGGAIALGHPLGVTGAMILGTLIDELERQDKRYGLATLCVGGGIGIATVIERL